MLLTMDQQIIQSVLRVFLQQKHLLFVKKMSRFRLNDILAVHRKAIENGEHNHIDSCTLMSRYGHKMNTIIGPMENIKITTPTDFFIFRAMVQVHENQQIFGF